MVFTNTLVTAHSVARRSTRSVHEHPLCAAITQLTRSATGLYFYYELEEIFFYSKVTLFMVSRLKLHGVTDLVDDLI